MLAERGHDLLLAGATEAKLSVLADELTAISPGRYVVHTLDATKSSEVDAAFERATAEFGSVTGATNLVGSIVLKPAHITSDAELFDTIAKNLHTAFFTVRAAAKAMAGGGSIVLASTVATRIGLANHDAIAAAKGGVNGLVLSAAATYAAKGIRVNAVAPGLVRTPLAAKITSSEIALKASTAMHPLGRIGEPADVATVIALLLDPAASWITGQIVGIDGGLGSVRGK
jgi:NAD(P)-dependent dehydrogenase (short-subunit alcohol dehydrogenase family)